MEDVSLIAQHLLGFAFCPPACRLLSEPAVGVKDVPPFILHGRVAV